VKKRKILSEKTNKKVWELLSKVLESGGTGFGANITINNKRLLIAGKTGTAQVYDKKIGRYSDSLRNASFLGFLKRPRNNYVIYIIVRQPKRDPEHSTGSTIAVPLFKNIVTQILDKFGSRLP
jgi:cell division protein FtsI/penicillin-binding protein 2